MQSFIKVLFFNYRYSLVIFCLLFHINISAIKIEFEAHISLQNHTDYTVQLTNINNPCPRYHGFFEFSNSALDEIKKGHIRNIGYAKSEGIPPTGTIILKTVEPERAYYLSFRFDRFPTDTHPVSSHNSHLTLKPESFFQDTSPVIAIDDSQLPEGGDAIYHCTKNLTVGITSTIYNEEKSVLTYTYNCTLPLVLKSDP